MPNRTTKLGLNTFLESDVVDWDMLNYNFEVFEKSAIPIETGMKTASYTGNVSGMTTWNYTKFSNGTVEMTTKLELSAARCNSGSAPPYASETYVVSFPFLLSSVNDVQMHLASATVGWPSDKTTRNVKDSLSIRVMSMTAETTDIYKQVYISVKGVM